jgi:YggT family protein
MLDRVYWFINSAVTVVIVAVIVLIVLRMIANKADLNPFAWTSLTIRRLTDPLIWPVRRFLAGFKVDAKYAPLVTILVVILLGWVSLQILSTLTQTVDGILQSLLKHALAPTIGYVLYGLLSFYTLLIFVRVMFSWIKVNHSRRWVRFVVNATEPLLGPLRRRMPLAGGLDISAFIAIIVVQVLQRAVVATLISG